MVENILGTMNDYHERIRKLIEEEKGKNPMNYGLTARKDLGFWVKGKSYFIRSVTMHLIGELSDISDKEILLKNAVWVADSGRFYDALKEGKLNEVEPFVNDVIVNRDSVVDATIWSHKIPDRQQ